MLSSNVKPSCMIAAPVNWVSTMRGFTGVPASATLTRRNTRIRPVSVSTSTSAAAPPTIQNGVAFGVSPVAGSGGRIRRNVAAGADDGAGLHAVFAAEQFGDRQVGARRHTGLGGKRVELRARVFGREPHGMAHMKQRARAERAHVVGRHIGIGRHDTYRLGCDAQRLGGDLRHRRGRALAHVDRAAIERAASVGRDRHGRGRRRRRNAGLEADRNAAAAPASCRRRGRTAGPSRSAAASRSSTASVAASRITVPVACSAPSRSRFVRRNSTGSRRERPGDQVGVALIGPDELRHAEAAQCAGRRPVGVDLRGIDRQVRDVVGPAALNPDFCATRGPISA